MRKRPCGEMSWQKNIYTRTQWPVYLLHHYFYISNCIEHASLQPRQLAYIWKISFTVLPLIPLCSLPRSRVFKMIWTTYVEIYHVSICYCARQINKLEHVFKWVSLLPLRDKDIFTISKQDITSKSFSTFLQITVCKRYSDVEMGWFMQWIHDISW